MYPPPEWWVLGEQRLRRRTRQTREEETPVLQARSHVFRSTWRSIGLATIEIKQNLGTLELETRPGCEETQNKSIRTGPESVVASGTVLPREMKTELTLPRRRNNCNVNGHVDPNDTQSSRFPISDNYDRALDLLKDRFGNKNMLIITHLSNLLNLTPVRNPTDIVGLRNLYDRAETQIRSLESLGVKGESYSNLLRPILLKQIPSELVLEFNRSQKDEGYLKNVQLADSYEFNDKEISILIGADYYYQVVTGRITRLNKNLVTVETLFGWSLQGQSTDSEREDLLTMSVIVNESNISKQLSEFWNLENLGIEAEVSDEENIDNDIMSEFE
ncbi:reverse transcriptase domain-containing protein [Trichonephila clavipes]|nr:reverse transcriptase domain-containing protein [Trichonephila clavipes]